MARAEARPIKVMSDYSCHWPLWLQDGGVDDEFAVEHDLSLDVCEDLLALQRFFDERFHWEGGWRGADDEARYAGLAVDAFYRLRRELSDDWDVTLDLWPVSDTAILAPLQRQGILSA